MRVRARAQTAQTKDERRAWEQVSCSFQKCLSFSEMFISEVVLSFQKWFAFQEEKSLVGRERAVGLARPGRETSRGGQSSLEHCRAKDPETLTFAASFLRHSRSGQGGSRRYGVIMNVLDLPVAPPVERKGRELGESVRLG